MANSIDVNPTLDTGLSQQVDASSAQRQVSHVGSTGSLLFFRPSSGSGPGTLLCEKDGLWLPDQVYLGICYHFFPHHRTWVFFCDSGQVFTFLWVPAIWLSGRGWSDSQTHLVWDSGFSSTNTPSLSAWYHTWYIVGLQLICLPMWQPHIWRDLPFPSSKFQNKAFIKNFKKKLFISYWGIAN